MKHVLCVLVLASVLLVGCNDAPKVTQAPAPVVKMTVLPVGATTGQPRIDAVREALKGEINTGGTLRMRSLTYDPATMSAAIEYVTDVGLTGSTTRDIVRAKMSELYAILMAPQGAREAPLASARIAAWGATTDSNGVTAPRLLVRTGLKAEQLVGVNWQADKSLLGLTVIPGKWTILDGGF